jgi:glycosyltransferase A (GT-A) superfamily protein (DUF2064 family)
MSGKKHAFLLFTKAPTPGVTKTRLTEARGGILTPEEAADFYRAALLDVVEIGFQALAELNNGASAEADGTAAPGGEPDRYDFWVSCTSKNDQEKLEELFEQAGPWPRPIAFISDRGKTFDEHFDDAFQQLFRGGYHAVVSIGGDLPTMPVSHIVQAFQWLDYFDSFSERGGFVQAPCQECGVSLVGYTAETPMDSKGVFYNLDGVPALDAYITKAAERGVPVASLTPVADVDDMGDMAHMASLLKAIAYSSQCQPGLFVARRTLDWFKQTGIVISTPPNAQHDPREQIDA